MAEERPESRDRLADLEALLPDMPAARDRVALGDELRHVGEWLQQHGSALDGFSQACADCAGLAREAGSAEQAAATEALEAIDGFASTLAEAGDARGLKAVRDEGRDALKAMRDFDAVLRRAYAAVLSAKLQPLGAAGDLIADLDPSSSLGSRLTAFAASAADVRVRQSQFASGARAVLEQASTLRAEVAALATDPEQMAFLEALLAGRATLRLLTPGVLAWLARLGGLDRFVIRPQAHR